LLQNNAFAVSIAAEKIVSLNVEDVDALSIRDWKPWLVSSNV